MTIRAFPLAALLATTAACTPAPVSTPAPLEDDAPITRCVEPCFTLMTERASPEQREMAQFLLAAEMIRIGLTVEYQPYTTSFTRRGVATEFTGSNVVGVLPATDINADNPRHIVIAAHYDTVPGSPGVDDNGSGVEIVLEVARRLAAMPRRTATVHFVMLDQEEVGLVGARVNASRWKESGIALESMHNIDMVGWDSDGDGVIEFDSNSEDLTALYLEVAEGLPISLLVTTYPNTDHEAYRREGFTVASISQEFEDGSENPDYHKPGDTEIQRPYYEGSRDLMLGVFERLVSR